MCFFTQSRYSVSLPCQLLTVIDLQLYICTLLTTLKISCSKSPVKGWNVGSCLQKEIKYPNKKQIEISLK